jgi:hypothetical protein
MTAQKTLLEHAYHWEKTSPERVFLTLKRAAEAKTGKSTPDAAGK